jgi:IS30 family transposase
MELVFAGGRRGGLVDPVPAAVPGRGAVRRPLSSEDRAVIAAGLRERWSYAEIGASIGRCRSVISREVRRNCGENGEYHGALAHRAAAHRRRRPKAFKLLERPGLCRRIEGWMDQGWSPRLIAQMLTAEQNEQNEQNERNEAAGCGTGGHTGRVSHETIYQALYVQTRGCLRADVGVGGRTVPTGRRSRSASGRPRPPTGRCPGTGRAT